MEITLPVYGILDFERSQLYDPNTGVQSESKTAWSAVKIINGVEIDFNFDCGGSDNKASMPEKEMWKYVETCLLRVDGQIDNMLLKSIPTLNALHESIFRKKVEDLGAHFLLEEIEILVSNFTTISYLSQPMCVGAAYKFGFFLESLVDDMALLDPYCTYNARFVQDGYLCGVYRE